MTNRRRPGSALVTAAAVLLPIAVHADSGGRESGGAPAGEGVVDGKGNIRVPEGYRSKYEYLGTWAIAADQGGGSKELHVVFASRGAVEAYRTAGHFAEGTVLVKEVFYATTAPMTTGTVSHSDTLKGWFVMVRDTSGRHAGNKLWGEGWGWSWFDAGKPTRTTSTDYKADCLGCHVPARATDWVYVGGYPSLRPEGVH